MVYNRLKVTITIIFNKIKGAVIIVLKLCSTILTSILRFIYFSFPILLVILTAYLFIMKSFFILRLETLFLINTQQNISNLDKINYNTYYFIFALLITLTSVCLNYARILKDDDALKNKLIVISDNFIYSTLSLVIIFVINYFFIDVYKYSNNIIFKIIFTIAALILTGLFVYTMKAMYRGLNELYKIFWAKMPKL